jgi:hypothetical protein
VGELTLADLHPIVAMVRRGQMLRLPDPCMRTIVKMLPWYQGVNGPSMEHELRRAVRMQCNLLNRRSLHA